MNDIDAAIAALVTAEIASAEPAPVAKKVTVLRVVRDATTKKMVAVEKSEGEKPMLIRWKGVYYHMPEQTTLIDKSAGPKREPPPMTEDDENDVWLHPDQRQSRVRLEDLDTTT